MSSAGIAALSIAATDSSPIGFDGSKSPHCIDESILIFLTVPDSSVMPSRVLESDSIASIKLWIQIHKGFLVKNQKIAFAGRELSHDDSMVRDFGLNDGDVLHLVIRLSDVWSVSVKTSCGKKLNFQVECRQTYGYIKQEIAKKGIADLNEQILVLDGKEVDDQEVINDALKNKDSAIHLFIRETAKIRTKQGSKGFELSIAAEEKKVVDGIPKVLDNNVLIEPVVNPGIKLSSELDRLVKLACDGLEKGNFPILASEGSGGTYFLQDEYGEYIGVFKPIDEEPMAENNPRGLPASLDGEGMKKGTRVGEGAFREVAAYILDHPIGGHRDRSIISDEIGFSGVPHTMMVKCLKCVFGNKETGYKIGSLQEFVKNNGSCEDLGPRDFPVLEVHKIAVLDLRLANADRHAGNILVQKEEDKFALVPIDHGYSLPENFEDCTFEWLYWPQSRKPFNSETLSYIKALNAEDDISLLKLHGWNLSLNCTRTLHISTMLLNKGAERGLSPYQIGRILCRETPNKESEIEELVHRAEGSVLPGASESALLEALSKFVDRHLDQIVVVPHGCYFHEQWIVTRRWRCLFGTITVMKAYNK